MPLRVQLSMPGLFASPAQLCELCHQLTQQDRASWACRDGIGKAAH